MRNELKAVFVLCIITGMVVFNYDELQSYYQTLHVKANDSRPTGSKLCNSLRGHVLRDEDLENCTDATACRYRTTFPRTEDRGAFRVLYNYIGAQKSFRCNESITLTTHGDYTFLDNLPVLVDRWRGPVSFALHAPGSDFRPTVAAIHYARECLTPLVKTYVTFHVYYGVEYPPESLPVWDATPNCSDRAPWLGVSASDLFKTRNKILYPVNVGRNIARETSLTHYVFPVDVELYPNPGLIQDFLAMVRGNDTRLATTPPKVYPVAIFEVEQGMIVPRNKTELVAMLKNGSAIPFHKRLCPTCHSVPRQEEWKAAESSPGMGVFEVSKRQGKFVGWEPIFIGTHVDPVYDERLSWEGMRDKMPQAYVMCLLDYDFLLLDNAFLVHKPGIKRGNSNPGRSKAMGWTMSIMRNAIAPEIAAVYGQRAGCRL